MFSARSDGFLMRRLNPFRDWLLTAWLICDRTIPPYLSFSPDPLPALTPSANSLKSFAVSSLNSKASTPWILQYLLSSPHNARRSSSVQGLRCLPSAFGAWRSWSCCKHLFYFCLHSALLPRFPLPTLSLLCSSPDTRRCCCQTCGTIMWE
jgi:hypothetical protein